MLPVVLFEATKSSFESVAGSLYIRIIKIVEKVRDSVSDQSVRPLQLFVGIPRDWLSVVCVTATPPFQEFFPTTTPILKIFNPQILLFVCFNV